MNKDYLLSKLENIYNFRKGMYVGCLILSEERGFFFFKEIILMFYRVNYKVLNLING